MTYNIHIVLEEDNPEDVRRVNHFASLMATHGTKKAAFRMLLDMSERTEAVRTEAVRLDEESIQRIVEVLQQFGGTPGIELSRRHGEDGVIITPSLAKKWA